jgi:teichuronic acid biosynthesis glycosyltransferase TuaC
LKVLVVTNMLPTAERPHLGTFVRDQVEDLRGLGIEVAVLFVDGVSRSANYIRGTAELRRRLSRSEFDLVHAHYGLAGGVAVTQRRVPVVTTFHGSDASGQIPWQKAVSWVVARACTPIFVSPELAASIGRGEAVVIPTAVDLALFSPRARDEARTSLGWDVDEAVALLPGARANPVKNAPLFDAALDEARKVVPHLRGVSLDGLSREEVALAMSAADVVVMTSTSEGSPVTIKESLACETPVVSVPVGDVQALVAGLRGCSVVGRDAGSLGQAILRALEDRGGPELRERVAHFGRVEIARRVAEVYGDVVGRFRTVG